LLKLKNPFLKNIYIER